MRYFLLLDNKQGGNEFIAYSLGIPVKICYSPETRKKIFGWLRGAWNVLSISTKGDTVISWYDFQAVILYWICLLSGKKRKIVCINVLLKDKSTLRNKVVSFLYRKALQSNSFKASVTSEEYGKWLNRKLGTNVQFALVHDVYHISYEYHKTVYPLPRSVFCGGSNGRDWHFIITLANLMPDITFNVVMPNDACRECSSSISNNMHIKCNISYDEFMTELCSSTIVCLPLNTESPAGLIVMFQAAANLKPIIITKTTTTQEYINEERGSAIQNDVTIWIKTIRSYFDDASKAKLKAMKFKKYLAESCNEDMFVKQIKSML